MTKVHILQWWVWSFGGRGREGHICKVTFDSALFLNEHTHSLYLLKVICSGLTYMGGGGVWYSWERRGRGYQDVVPSLVVPPQGI